MKRRRHICVITGTRAEYGLLRWVMHGIQRDPGLQLQLIVTGSHLSTDFGSTYLEVENDGFSIDRKIDLSLDSDTSVGISRSASIGLLGFAEAFDELHPDCLLVLGDRYEILSAAFAALVAKIPVAHVHGGELTKGAIDDAIRHAITKMAHLHFVAAEEYRKRVIQLGEHPSTVFQVGGLGVDSLHHTKLLDRNELEQELGFQLGKRNLLITFHPVTLDDVASKDQFGVLLEVLSQYKDIKTIFTLPNADPGNRIIHEMIEHFVAEHPNARAYASLGQQRYLSCMKHVDAVVGNSSSGLLEAPSLGVGTINIGSRQDGRLRASSVIDCKPEQAAIRDSIERIYSSSFQRKLRNVTNPYGIGGASEAIVDILRETELSSCIKKHFFNVSYELRECYD